MRALLLLAAGSLLIIQAASADGAVKVGSKQFTESVILGEMTRQLIESGGSPAEHRAELGGSRILWNALLSGEIDLYPEYTGTLSQELIGHGKPASPEQVKAALEKSGIRMTRALGFNNTYALGMTREKASKLGISEISDLRRFPGLKLGLSSEFLQRSDGWPRVRSRYRLSQQGVRGLDHDVAYRALRSGDIDVLDLYSTDAEIRYYGLSLLKDDQKVFPRYDAILLYRADLETRRPEAVKALRKLEGRITESEMIEMNARAKLEKVLEEQVAAEFLRSKLGIQAQIDHESLSHRILARLAEHLNLVLKSLVLALLVAIPLGIWAARRPRAGRLILGAIGIIQTMPALALLVMLIQPLKSLGLPGIGDTPAIIALFLYSLLPIARNTHAGLVGIPLQLQESAEVLGLGSLDRLRLIELPLASATILAGIKTAAVINVGFATLGALIGAGGFGQPILTGIRLDDYGLILQGAVPAAILALLMQGVFDLSERVLVPRGLRLGQRLPPHPPPEKA